MIEPSIDHYALLGISRESQPAEIRAAYVAQVKACHPDFAVRDDAFDRFQSIRQAYECLRSPESRARYDRQIAERAEYKLRRIGQAQRRLRKLDRQMPAVAVVRPSPVPHWRAAAVVAASGSLVLSVCYLLLR